MEEMLKYPIGQQNFKNLRKEGCIYVDKTGYIEKLLTSGNRYYFLGRPRRFGKSLFLSTLEFFFKGEKDLFHGLKVESFDWDWQPYPVLRIDLNTDRFDEPERLELVLDTLFRDWEKEYEVEVRTSDLSQRFKSIIKAAHEKTGRQVVVLVDEYDKPLVSNLNKGKNFEHYRLRLASLYSNFKSSAEHLRLVFLTGVSRFSKLSVFSDLNNINDISLDDAFADICGITEEEMMTRLKPGLIRLSEINGVSFDQICDQLKRNYDGYKFAILGSDIYNPWSLLCALSKGRIDNYWNETGKPSVVAESLKRMNVDLESTFDSYCTADDLRGLDLLSPDPRALLYQAGYLTIKSYNSKIRRFHLGIPNEEVKSCLGIQNLYM